LTESSPKWKWAFSLNVCEPGESEVSSSLVQTVAPVAAAGFESYSQARANDYGRIDFSGIADAVCDLARIERARVPKGWKPA